eukprot:TRINITY_DN7192_c0_g1_i1.p1 TRINITY_DN7192_c0_g1~~TRINITY_DN7192_c0_g1_i1.p1  ORF type:complete len:183 (+),score=47.78 TRINITY_DN7192_c0_g1_i1:94-642(+)
MVWKPFFLDRNLPVEGKNKMEHYIAKFGKGRVESMLPHMKEVGKEHGINFSYGGLIGNTMSSHRLIEYAGTIDDNYKTQNKLVDALFKRYFEQEKNIGDPGTLLDAAREAGLDEGRARAVIESDEYQEDVDTFVTGHKFRVTGVPHFTINGKLRVPGAQDTETWVHILREVEEGDAPTTSAM